MRWSWARDLTAPAGQALAEALCLDAYVLVLTPPDAQAPGLRALLLLFVLGAWTGRAGSRLVPHALGRGAMLAVSAMALPLWWAGQGVSLEDALSAAAHDPAAMLAPLLLGLAVWCRGVWLGAVPATTEMLTRRFLVGSLALISLAILLALAKGTGVERYTHTLQLLVLGYFIVGPAVLALVHLQALHDRAATPQPASLRWVPALIVPMALVAGIGLWLTHDFAPMLALAMHGAVRGAALLAQLLWWLLRPVLDLLEALLALLQPGHHKLPEAIRPHAHIPPPRPLVSTVDDSAGLSPLLLLVPAALLVLVFARLLLRRIRRRGVAPAVEERTSLWSWGLFQDQLRAAWLARLAALRGAADSANASAQESAGADGRPVTMRAVYRALLRWAAAQGHRRGPAATPQELRQELAVSLPQAADAVALITSAYEAERYGGVVLPATALAAARAAADSLVATQDDEPGRQSGGMVRHATPR